MPQGPGWWDRGPWAGRRVREWAPSSKGQLGFRPGRLRCVAAPAQLSPVSELPKKLAARTLVKNLNVVVARVSNEKEEQQEWAWGSHHPETGCSPRPPHVVRLGAGNPDNRPQGREPVRQVYVAVAAPTENPGPVGEPRAAHPDASPPSLHRASVLHSFNDQSRGLQARFSQVRRRLRIP